MPKVIRKLRPSNYWRIGEHESWFTDMAAKGLHLKKMGLHFAQFVQGEPEKVKYRIDVALNKKITPEQRQMYAESGWDYVTSYGAFNVFSSPAELNASELHTDPAEQAYTLQELDKKLLVNALIVFLATVLTIGMMSAIWFLDGTPTLVLVEGNMLQQTILTAFVIYSTFTSYQAAISIRALRKTLSEGKPINHHAPWKHRQRSKSIVALLYIIAVAFTSSLPFVHIAMRETKTLPVASTDLPIVRLADVEQNVDLVRDESSYKQDNVDWGNRYTFDWSILAPLQYESDESGIVPGVMWQDGSGIYSPSIHTRVYQLRLPVVAESLMADLLERSSIAYRGGEYIKTKHPGFDSLIVHEADGIKELFASKGKAVTHVRYYGYAGIETLIAKTAQEISLIAE